MTEIKCPSGLKGEIRKFRVGDLSVFTDKRARRQGKDPEAALAKSIWLNTTDRGPYVFDGSLPPWQGDVLYGDRFYALMQARILTRGTSYVFRVQCENGACEQTFQWEVNLDDLVVQELSTESKKTFENGNEFTTKLPSSCDVVGWSLLTGRLQRRTQDYIKEHGAGVSVMYAARLKSINDDRNARQFVDYMANMDLDDFNALEREMVQADCGYETTLEVECPECDRVQEVELPMGRDFFLESRSRWVKKSPQKQQSGGEDTAPAT
jgi:hypothetical protein